MTNMNTSFRSRGIMPPIPQETPIVGGWNPPSSKPNPNFHSLGWSSQMGDQFTSCISSFIPSSSMLIFMNTFIMVNPPLSPSIPSKGNQFIVWETLSTKLLLLGET
jgi:hypothetical protein